jgi:hypothetical protein
LVTAGVIAVWPRARIVLVAMGALLLLGTGAALLWGTRAIREAFGAEYAKLRLVEPGMSETDVHDLLGQPFRSYRRADAPADWHVTGYARPVRRIDSKILIYVRSEAIAYVYIGPDGLVQEVFVGGS